MSEPVVARDPRAERSRRALLDAVGALVDELAVAADLTNLTITAVVARAGVSRPTFYQHFDDVPAVLRAAALERLEAAFPDEDELPISRDEAEWAAHAEDVMTELLEHLQVDAAFYRRVLNGPGAIELHRDTIALVVERILARSPLGPVILTSSTLDPIDRVTIITGGLLWMVMNWLETDRRGPNSARQMAGRISRALIELSVEVPDAVSRVIAATPEIDHEAKDA